MCKSVKHILFRCICTLISIKCKDPLCVYFGGGYISQGFLFACGYGFFTISQIRHDNWEKVKWEFQSAYSSTSYQTDYEMFRKRVIVCGIFGCILGSISGVAWMGQLILHNRGYFDKGETYK